MKDNPVQNSTPVYVPDRDVLGQIKSNRISVIKRFKEKSLIVPDLKVTYAGLGKRTIAKLIDLAIVIILLLILEKILFNVNHTNNGLIIYRLLIAIFTWIFYNWVFDTSRYQATIGKMILKLKIIDLYGKRMSVLRSLLRCITTIISILPIGLGIWHITTDPKKRSWHDLISGTYVIIS